MKTNHYKKKLISKRKELVKRSLTNYISYKDKLDKKLSMK